MDEGLLSLKWNDHRSTFLYVIKSLRKRELYSDVTLACSGKFYRVHKIVLSTCSEYFGDIFEHISCANPVIVLKDIECKNLEYLLDYMYIGEVNVKQNELASLVEVAECLKIKGLATPKEDFEYNTPKKRIQADPASKNYFSPSNKRKKSKDTSELILNIDKNHSSQSIKNLSIDKDPLEPIIKTEPISEIDIDENNKVNSVKQTDDLSDESQFTTELLEVESDELVKGEPLDKLSPEIYDEAGPSSTYEDIPDISQSLESGSSNSQEDSLRRTNLTQDLEYNTALSIENSSSTDTVDELSDLSIILKRRQRSSSMNNDNSSNYSTTLTLKDFQHSSNIDHLNVFSPNSLGRPYVTYPVADGQFEIYKCGFCSYTTRYKGNMKTHGLIHTGEKPFHCQFCKYKSTSKQRVKTHIMSKHMTKYK